MCLCVCVCVCVCVCARVCVRLRDWRQHGLLTSLLFAQVYVWPCVRITRDGVVHTLHARRKYYTRFRYDFVHVHGGDDAVNPWLARVLAIIKVEIPGDQQHVDAAGFLPLAIIQWLDRDPVDLVPGTPTYKYLPTPQAIELPAIVRPVKLLDSPCVAADGTRRVCAVPEGKTAAFNALFRDD